MRACRASSEQLACRCDVLSCDRDLYFTTQQFQKKLNTSGAVQSLQHPERACERTGEEPNAIADGKIVAPENERAARIRRLNEGLHDSRRHRERPTILHDQALNAERAIDAPPPLSFNVENNKDVAREDWRKARPELSAMTARSQLK